MATPNNSFETLTTETLTIATGGVTYGGGSNNWQVHHELSPILHSLNALSTSSANNQAQQNSTMMMGMMAALVARR